MMNMKTLLTAAVLMFSSVSGLAADQKILFLRKEGKGFDEVFSVMKKDLETRYKIDDFIVSKSSEYAEVKTKIAASAPTHLVVMDNKPLEYALKFNGEQTDPKKRVQGTALMGLNLKSILKGNKEISGVAFESPAYTMLIQFRYIVKKPLKNVVVFYRKSIFQETVDDATKQLSKEGIQVNPINVEAEGAGKEAVEKFVSGNLRKYAAKADKYDVFWVLLDSGILTQHLFQEVWLPVAAESKIPFVSGTEDFASPTMNFATFGISPNFSDLGSQAIQQIDSIITDHVAPGDLGVEELISVNKVLNLKRAHELGLVLKDENLKDIKTLQ